MSGDTTTGRDPRISEDPHDDERELHGKPKLAYVKPKLLKRGDVTTVTRTIVWHFSP